MDTGNHNDECIDSMKVENENEVSFISVIIFIQRAHVARFTFVLQDSLSAALHSHVGMKDSAHDSGEPENEIEKVIKKGGRPPMIGSSSKETFLSLSRTY